MVIDEFELISIPNFSKIKSIRCKYSIICFEKLNNNNSLKLAKILLNISFKQK